MSNYTTGEIAKLCGVTVRTVQYYDNRNLLVPSALTEGGRRLYSEDDLKRMKIICFLRELDLSINVIAQLLAEAHPEAVIELLLQQQEEELREEIRTRKEKLEKLESLQKEIRKLEHFTVESIGDIANLMENKKKLRRVRITMLTTGILMDAVEIGTLILAIKTGIWWPFILGMAAVVAGAVWLLTYYYKQVSYICPKCHAVFRPTFKQMFFANHTPTTRKLTCTACGHRGFCVETCNEESHEKA